MPYEMERTMQFILDQQVKISANVQRHDENFLVIETKLLGLKDVVLKLADSHVLVVNSHRELADAFKRLQEAQTETQERLNAFIVFVEKYIASRNGSQQAAH